MHLCLLHEHQWYVQLYSHHDSHIHLLKKTANYENLLFLLKTIFGDFAHWARLISTTTRLIKQVPR